MNWMSAWVHEPLGMAGLFWKLYTIKLVTLLISTYYVPDIEESTSCGLCSFNPHHHTSSWVTSPSIFTASKWGGRHLIAASATPKQALTVSQMETGSNNWATSVGETAKDVMCLFHENKWCAFHRKMFSFVMAVSISSWLLLPWHYFVWFIVFSKRTIIVII
jgi:hypothetical protein